MTVRASQVKDEFDRPVPGAQIFVYKPDGTEAVLTSDGVTPLAQPVVTDQFGTYSYYHADSLVREDVRFAGKLRYREMVGKPEKGDPGGNIMAIGLLKDADGMDLQGADLVRTSGNIDVGFGGGFYGADDTIDLGAHPKAGFTASGGQRMRILRSEVLTPQHFVEATDPDMQNAMERARDYLLSIATGAGGPGFYRGSQKLFCPAKASPTVDKYLMHARFDMNHKFLWEGEGGQGGPGSFGTTCFQWPDGVEWVGIQGPQTSGSDVADVAAHQGAFKAGLKNLMFAGPQSGTVADRGLILLRAAADIEDVYGRGGQGRLIQAWTGNVNGHNYGGDISNSSIKRVKGESCLCTLDIRGTNSNVISTEQVESVLNLQYGILDSNGAGANTHRNPHATFNGILAPAAGPFTQCWKSGNIYTPNIAAVNLADPAATSALLAANAPSGTTAHNNYWCYVRAGSPTATQPDHASGGPWAFGGDYFVFTPWATEFDSPYSEYGGGFSQSLYNQPQWKGGTLDRTQVKGGHMESSGNDCIEFTRNDSMGMRLRSRGGWTYEFRDYADFLWWAISANYAGPAKYFAPITHRFQVDAGGTVDVLDVAYAGLALAAGKTVSINGQQVVGARGAALPADAADLAGAIALANAIKARLKTTGGHGLVAD